MKNITQCINTIIKYESIFGLLDSDFEIIEIKQNTTFKNKHFEVLIKIGDNDVKTGFSPIKYWGFNGNEIIKFFNEWEISPLLKKLYTQAGISLKDEIKHEQR